MYLDSESEKGFVVGVVGEMGEVKSFPWSSCSTSLISSWTEEVPEVIWRPSLSILRPKTKNSIAARILVYRRGTIINTLFRTKSTVLYRGN